METATPPPVRKPWDLIVAKLHVASNDFFLQLPNILDGIVFVLIAWFGGKLVARGIRKGSTTRDWSISVGCCRR